jgi:N-acetyl-anhydromuramyl-L-alanine amidase AmpD
VKVGNRIDFSGTDYRISKTFGNKIVDFVDEPSGSMKLKPTSSKASNRHLSPVVQVMGDDGKVVEGSMNLLIPKKSKDTHSFGQITGGRVIFKTPKGEQYLVSGSAEDIKKAFKQIKGNNPYVEAVTLDNGSYAMGLRNKNQKITADQLRAYQGSNSTGSAFLYLQPGNYTRQSSVAPPAAAAPKFQFKDVQMKTPNIRTEKDESFKKGHSLKNEQKAIILHHTGYSDASGIDKGMSAAMRGVNQQFSKPGESSHVVIDFDGTRYNYAKPDQVTFHAGKSYLNGRDNVNDFGIGIEFQGDTDRKHLTDKQINSFVEYIAPIIKKNKIPLSSVVTHKKIRQDYMKTNPQDKDVYSKPDLNEYDYKRILKALKDKKVYKFGGSTTSSWLDKYN